jgi:hypothetical protein
MNKEIYGILIVNVQQTIIKDIQVLYFYCLYLHHETLNKN